MRSVKIIYRGAKFIDQMRPPHMIAKITPYVVAPSYERYNYIEGMAVKLRQDTNNPMSTKIWMGETDFELRIKYHRTNKKYDENFDQQWEDITPLRIPSSAPVINLGYQPKGKAPGRTTLPTPPLMKKVTKPPQKAPQPNVPAPTGNLTKETNKKQTTLGNFEAPTQGAMAPPPPPPQQKSPNLTRKDLPSISRPGSDDSMHSEKSISDHQLEASAADNIKEMQLIVDQNKPKDATTNQ